MKHRTYQNRMPRAVNLLAVLTLIGAAFMPGGFGAAHAQEGPSPWLTAFPEREYIEAVDWQVGVSVHLAIDDPNTPGMPDYQDDTTTMIPEWETNPARGWAIFPLTGYDLKVGDLVVMTGGGFTIEHVVRNLAITGVDMEADTVAGTADPGVQLQVWVHGQSPLDVSADGVGNWQANFAGVYDIDYGTAGRAWIIAEGGNATAVDWSAPPPPPTPWLIAFPENEAVEGWEWPEGATVTLTINNAPSGFYREGTAEVTSWGDPRTYVRLEFGDEYDLKLGDEVTLTDGATTRTHIVQNLSVSAVDADADTVAGTADVGAVVQVWPHGFDQYFIEDTAEDGTWFANFGELGFHTIEETGGRSQIVADGNATAVDWNVPAPPLVPWRDEFDGALAEDWHWVNENPDKWNLTEQPGFLRIYNSPFVTGGENLVLRPVAQGDFMIKTRVLFEPDTNFQFAGLVIYQDENNFLQLGRAFCDIPDVCVGNGIYFDKILGGNLTDSNFATPVGNPSEVYLRLERRGDMVRAFYSLDQGMTWYEIGTHWIPSDFQVNGVGLTASQDYNTPDWDIPADFDFFELTEGWGFLPEGFHDYDSGDVPSWACNAGGWAADPDDRAARLNVDVVVDHRTVASLIAEEFRQDLLDAGVCEGGNCGFSTSLWGTISSYEPHRIDAWAQDNSTGEWVLLSNSAKTLTCRTYDIYTFDPQTGETRQITNLPNTHEFNPRWSPDGKKIVHDTWNTDWSSHGVYLTDVKTGVSTPLAGAEGGSYPTWSPSGKWIAFDRGADNDYRLFVVPPTGGTPKLVAEDAFMATWAPNSQRLAFHRPSDGAIWTTDLNGSNATKVAERGNGPAWSPDGEWIAFEVDGDVWKVHVKNNGNPLGAPIQLTSSPAWEGRPSWSNNSKTIAFHAGMGQDTDIWTIPASGGTATWLTGAPVFGDYDPNYSFNGSYVAYSSFSPNGQAVRQWVAAYTYDLPGGFWTEGDHSYHFDAVWSGGSEITPEVSFNVSGEAQPYDGYALLRPLAVRAGVDCPAVDAIRPDQPTRFLLGYVTDSAVTYSEALVYFDSLTARAVWEDGESAELTHHEIIPFRSDDWFQYVCTFTR